MQRPDLLGVRPDLIAYIEYLENQISEYRSTPERKVKTQSESPVPETQLFAEPPTKYTLITSSYGGYVKRTYRHLYVPQHRGGMGIFDIDLPDTDYPRSLLTAEVDKNVLVFTDRARVFRFPASRIVETEIHSKGQNLFDRLPLEPGEGLAAILPEQAQGFVALLSKPGKIRILRHHMFGEHMRPGTPMYNYKEFGPLASVCWTGGDRDLFVVTKKGIGIRFAEKAVSPQSELAIKLGADDEAVALTPVDDESAVLLLGSDGKGAIRLMSGFAANKSPGGSGKIAIKNDQVIGAVSIEGREDIFAISRLSKIIRFPSDEVLRTEGVVQGVICVNLRADEVVAMTKSE